MGVFTPYTVKTLLDFIGDGEAVTAPEQRWVGLAWGTPATDGGSELDASFGYVRQSVTFNAAASPNCSASLAAPVTFASFSSACSVLGAQLWDGSGSDASMLLFCTLQTARTLDVGNTLWIPAGSLCITLS